MSDETAAAPAPTGSLFHRKIEFLPAKRHFAGFSNGGGFKLETLNPTTSDPTKQGGLVRGGSSSMMLGKRPVGGEATMELAIDPELSFGFTMRRIGAGLENLGNTCFLNSVLQCLTYTEPLAAYLQSGRHKSTCRKTGFCAFCAIQNHVSRALQSTGRSLAPKDLVSNLRCISRNFRNCRQEDAHEYMVNLLESMHKCCLPSGVPSESPSAFEKSLVHKIFGGRLRSQVKCTQCSFCSDKFDPFLDLSLEINKADSLHKALAHFTAKEYLDGGAREYQCQKCKQKVKALKQLSIHKAPYVLNVHLKRFGCHQPGQKIDKKVHFGPTLDLKPFVTGAYDGDLKYTLYGVLVHYGGSTHSGHYYCFVRTSSGMWYSLDDHRVCNVSEKRVLEERAYMLFYVRDRKNVIPKKPVDVGHAQNMILNAMGNKMQSNFNQVSNKKFQNGPTDINRILHPVPALTRVDVAVAGALKETITKGKSIQGTVVASSSLQKEVKLNASSVMPIVKDDTKWHPNGGDCSTQSALANISVEGLNNNLAFVATGNEINQCNKVTDTNDKPGDLVLKSDCLSNVINNNNSTEVAMTPVNNQDKVVKNMSDPLARKPESNGNHNSSIDSLVKHSISQKECDEKVSNPSSQLEKPNHVDVQVGGSIKENTEGESSKEMELAGLKSTRSIPIPEKAFAHKSQRKLKKKHSKRQITLTRLSSSFILGTAFSSRKKMKKKGKRSALKIDILTQEHLKPSTSEVTRPLPMTVNSRKKNSKLSSSKSENISTAKNENKLNCKLVEKITDEKLRDRVGQNDAAIVTDKAPQCISSSPLVGNSSIDSKGSNTLKESRRDSMQNEIMNMLTRGLDETREWDEVEHLSSQFTGRSEGESVSIGYIGDEWDQEYDKGKRKKVRTSFTDFGGPNPFQEIATQKTKFKKAKFDRSRSANQPYRI